MFWTFSFSGDTELKIRIPYCGSSLRRTVAVDWKLSESPSVCWVADSTLARGCLVSVGEVGVDMSVGL